MMISSIVFLIGLAHLSQALFFRPSDKWNGLQVRWGLNPFNSNNFFDLPRTASAAERRGFRKISDCSTSGPWRGQRYVLGTDYSVIVLYDVSGYIAGIQASIPNNQTDGYPDASLRPPFSPDGNRQTISAYFVDPAIICTTGRSHTDFNNNGTGTGLWLDLDKTGVPERYVQLPLRESALDTSTWTPGKCFRTMGKHYWNNLSYNMECSSSFPAFLMYNNDKLNSFGWALMTDLSSPRWEHPSRRSFGMFMVQPPRCLMELPRVSTMHVYMTSNALLNLC